MYSYLSWARTLSKLKPPARELRLAHLWQLRSSSDQLQLQLTMTALMLARHLLTLTFSKQNKVRSQESACPHPARAETCNLSTPLVPLV